MVTEQRKVINLWHFSNTLVVASGRQVIAMGSGELCHRPSMLPDAVLSSLTVEEATVLLIHSKSYLLLFVCFFKKSFYQNMKLSFLH